MFWNQCRNDLTDFIAAAAIPMRLDLLMLCETGASPERTLEGIRPAGKYTFATGNFDKRFHVFARFPKRYIKLAHEAERFLIFKILLPARDPFLLMVLHAPSKAAGWSTSGQALEAAEYARSLRALQNSSGIRKSVVVGDFNMNPFEPGMTGASAFNAVMDSRQARNETRTVQKNVYPYFYNPMWALMGDLTPGPPASFFLGGGTQEELQWHMLDQVIVSAEMIDFIDTSTLRILEQLGPTRLVTPLGRPRAGIISDHLPLYFELRI